MLYPLSYEGTAWTRRIRAPPILSQARLLGMPGAVAVRNTGNVVVAVAVWFFCLVALVDGILRGSADYILHDVLVVAAISVAAWIVFFRPRLIVDNDGLRMINLIRSYDIPFASLVTWRVGGALVVQVRTEGGQVRKITSWGAPGVRRQRPQLSSVMGRNRGPAPDPGTAGMANQDLRSVTEVALEQREREWHRSHPAAGEDITNATWNWLPLTVLVVLIVARVAVG